jgi:predicted DNA-binding antitoxin AbrB/MazE fold protein
MTKAVRAIFDDGVFKPEEAVPLKDKTRVQLVISSAPEPTREDDPTGWKTLDELIGFIKDGPEEPVGRDHDRYLYGR